MPINRKRKQCAIVKAACILTSFLPSVCLAADAGPVSLVVTSPVRDVASGASVTLRVVVTNESAETVKFSHVYTTQPLPDNYSVMIDSVRGGTSRSFDYIAMLKARASSVARGPYGDSQTEGMSFYIAESKKGESFGSDLTILISQELAKSGTYGITLSQHVQCDGKPLILKSNRVVVVVH